MLLPRPTAASGRGWGRWARPERCCQATRPRFRGWPCPATTRPLGDEINRDPVQEQGGHNLYTFDENQPITKVDSFGTYSIGPGYGALPIPTPGDSECPCEVHCTLSGRSIWSIGPRGGYFGITTYAYDCVDCKGNTWTETKRQFWANPIGRFPGFVTKPPPNAYSR